MTTPTATSPFDRRWQDILAMWQNIDNRWLFVVVGIFIGILLTPAIEQITGDLNALVGNLVPEAIGIIFTVLILDRLADNRTREELKYRLLNEVRSPSASTAITALDWLRRENWIDANTFKDKTMINVNWEGAYVGDLNLEDTLLIQANFKSVISTTIVDGEPEIHPLNLCKAKLYKVNLTHAVLEEANLTHAVLEEANLTHTVLREANLTYAALREANLTYAVLDGANLTNASLWGADLTNASLWGADLTNASLRGANLTNAFLRGANLTHVVLENVNLMNADLQGASLMNTYSQDANLTSADLYHANLTHAKLREANLMNANLREANLMNADLIGANLMNTNLLGANLMNADLLSTKFDEKTVLPDAEESKDENGHRIYDADGNIVYTRYWTVETDMTRYGNPKHPDFWQPDWAKKPNE